jgi:hypothetical protein
MSNPISQLSGRSDLNRPLSRITPRISQEVSATAPVSEVSPVNTVPQPAFNPGSMDTLDAAFPSLEVITRRILQGMQDAMDRAIEEAAREAIDTQRRQRAADAERVREAKLDDLLTELSQEPTLGSEPNQPAGAVPGNSGRPTSDLLGQSPGADPGQSTGQSTAEVDVRVVGEAAGSGTPGASAETATAVESNGRLQGVKGGQSQPINREAAAAVLGEVVKSVRQAPPKEAAQIHRSENLAYSAVLLNV